MKRYFLIAALVAATATPAGAAQQPEIQMPFPALMNALFGAQAGTNNATARQPSRAQTATSTRQATAQPQQDYRQPYTQYGARDTASFLQPGQVLPSYSGRSTAARSASTRSTSTRSSSTSGSGNVASLQPAPRTSTSSRQFNPAFAPKVVAYNGSERPGTIIINTNERFLYLVQDGGRAKRYGVGVGRPGFEWRGTHNITRKAEWPGWTPPPQMRKRQPGLPAHMPGGPNNPLGARAMYLGSTLYRIHGSNQPWSIGRAVSSGCIRMRNEDVIDLYERVGVGTTVKVI